MTARERESGVHAPARFRRPWLLSDRPVPRRFVAPLDRFLRTEVGSGSLLLAAAVIALIWSNVSTGSYEDVWTTLVTIEIADWTFEEDLRHVINDLLMAGFFFVVALEVKREGMFGGLRDRRTAAVPIAAAFGTMAGAAATYLAINLGSGGEPSGWAIPIATDIAFALSVLGVAGRRAPRELRAFLLTLAVVDDLATIAVIAIFFTDDLSLLWLGAAVGIVGLIVLLQRVGVRHLAAYVIAAGLLWLAVFESGVHATIAGVVLGFLTPAFAFHQREPTATAISSQLQQLTENPDREVTAGSMREVSRLAGEAVSPLTRMEEAIHPWSAFLILPLFALANAGVPVSLDEFGDALSSQVGLGIFLGLAVGAPVVGFGFAWLLCRLTPARLAPGLDWPAIAGLAPLKGIGFTVAIFIALLAFDDPALQEQAKLAILAGSAASAVIGVIALNLRQRVMQGGKAD